jgi:hypothetical protein
MTETAKKLNELRTVLSNKNNLRITQAIRLMRNEPPLAGAIALLISHYDGSDNHSIRQLIKEFMNDMKSQAFCAEVVEEIKKDHKADTLEMLASSCWQSGLDYSDYCSDFAVLFLTGNYMTALECFTVIESSAGKISKKRKDMIIKKIQEGATELMGEKAPLAVELVAILSEE